MRVLLTTLIASGCASAATGPDPATAPDGGTSRRDAGDGAAGDASAAPCVGVRVPGDYATVQAAITALGAAGGTICVGPGPQAGVSTDVKGPFVVIGEPTTELAQSGFSAQGPGGSVVLRGLRFTGGLAIADLTTTIERCAIRGTIPQPGSALAIDTSGIHAFAVTIDASEIVGGADHEAIFVNSREQIGGLFGAYGLTITNSYIHEGRRGLLLNTPYAYPGAAPTFVIDSNTFERNGTAIEWDASSSKPVPFQYVNDLFVDNGVAIELGTGAAEIHRNNALFGNTTNFVNMATPGAGDVTSDPGIDGGSPPSPEPGSPLRGAGDPSVAPDHDFMGRPRGSSVDIGAVQGA